MHAPVLCSIPGWKVTTDELVSAFGGLWHTLASLYFISIRATLFEIYVYTKYKSIFLGKNNIYVRESEPQARHNPLLPDSPWPLPPLPHSTKPKPFLGLRDGLWLETYIVNDLLSYTICLTIFAESAPYFVIKQQWKYQIQNFYRKYFKYFYKI